MFARIFNRHLCANANHIDPSEIHRIFRDISAQTRQVLSNLKQVLEAAGAEISDIVRLRTYVSDLNPSLLEPIGKAIGEFYGSEAPAANTMIGVQSLALPEFLVEIEATAVLP